MLSIQLVLVTPLLLDLFRSGWKQVISLQHFPPELHWLQSVFHQLGRALP
jgi:hypothetical protein